MADLDVSQVDPVTEKDRMLRVLNFRRSDDGKFTVSEFLSSISAYFVGVQTGYRVGCGSADLQLAHL